ncbi:MAG: alpha/beta hydrolase [Pseudomonadota bacterium]
MRAKVFILSWMKKILIAVAAVYITACLFMYFMQARFLYSIDTTDVAESVASVPFATNVDLATSDGETLQAWWVPPRDATQVVYLYFQGNAETLLSRDKRFGVLTKDGAGLLGVSWRGYGGSSGKPSEAGLRLDAVAAYEWLRDQYTPERIVVFGESLGTGIAVWLSSEHAAGGLVLDSAYTSILDVARSQYPWLPVGRLARERFESLDLVSKITVPVFMFHCTEDPVVPFVMGEKMFSAFPTQQKMFSPMPGVCHVPSVETLMPRFKELEAVVRSHYASY